LIGLSLMLGSESGIFTRGAAGYNR